MTDLGHSTYFSEDRQPAAIDAWFDAMAAVYRTAPWDAGLNSGHPLFATLGGQSLSDAVLHPLGRGGPDDASDGAPADARTAERPGFTVLIGPDDLEAWLALEASGGTPRTAPGFRRLELTFGPLADAHPDVRRELEKHDRGLGDAVPSVWRVDDEGVVQVGTVDDMRRMEAVAEALAEAIETAPGDGGLLDAWRTGEPATRATVSSAQGIEVELSTRPLVAEVALPASELLDALRGVDEAGNEWGAESGARVAIEHRLERRFVRSPEAADLPDGIGYWSTLAEWATSNLGVTIASLDTAGLSEIVFDIVPRKVSADPDFARPFIECLRAFYRWLDREYALPQAQACLAVLEAPDAIERLEMLMADDTNFGMAKTMVMAARAEGIDPSTPEGAMQMKMMVNQRLMAAREPMGLPGFGPYDDAPSAKPALDPAVKAKRDAKRKAGRKAARKARKKSR